MEAQILIEAVLIGLAGFRIANLLVNEAGPANLFDRLRDFVGANKPGQVSGFLPSLFSCVFCMSVWSTIGCYLLWLIIPTGVMIISAMSIALIVNRIVSEEH